MSNISILVYEREFNLKKWFIYWIPKNRILGVKDSKNIAYEKIVPIQTRMDLMKVSKTLVEETWSDIFAQSALHIDQISEKELVLTFALQRNITLERCEEISGQFDELLYQEYTRLKTILNCSPKPESTRKRTSSKIEESTDSKSGIKNVPNIAPLRKRTSKIISKPTGPTFEYDE
ncbi:unnamed protein product [Caenorhabditis angaria]|uniref:Uncharacterized protein n=1 Tax=Caenorhabditis angaria TaxID=860376 RepID=A0A9P1IUL9_9PELO|nr:unnamed protein product [Caenorhabditis angaria]